MHVALTIIVLLFSVSAAAAGPEARCTEFGVNDNGAIDASHACRCSEPLGANDGAVVGQDGAGNEGDVCALYKDPSDSPDTSECGGNSGAITGSFLEQGCPGGLSSQLNPISNPDLNYGGTNPPTIAVEMLDGYVLIGQTHNAPSGSRRWCMRWYERFGYDFIPVAGDACPYNNAGKIVDFDSNEPGQDDSQWWFQIPAGTQSNPANCPDISPVDPSDWKGSEIADRAGPDTIHALTGNDPNWSFAKCRKDINGNNGWCRLEFCGAGTSDLAAAGTRYYQARVTALDDGSVVTGTTGTWAYAAAMEAHFNNNPGGTPSNEQSRREISYYMEAAWTTDTGQWIGPAYEIEHVSTSQCP